MKKFLLVSSGLLIFAVLVSVITFIWLSHTLEPTKEVQMETGVMTEDAQVNTVDNSAAAADDIPLSSLELSDFQRNLLEKAGVDTETFVITPAMQTCAAGKIGQSRVEEIIAGDSPNALEITRLSTCANVE